MAQSKPETWTLVILAAGSGSRFGGNKQLATFTQCNISLMELNIIHAFDEGMTNCVFVVSDEIQPLIEQSIIPQLPSEISVTFVQQDIEDLPIKTFNNKRVKPWGTAHALWCCRQHINEAFVVINADDYYGQQAYMYANKHIGSKPIWAMTTFQLGQTLSVNGGVNRGICTVSEHNKLESILEATQLTRQHNEVEGLIAQQPTTFELLTPISMNFWVFQVDIFDVLEGYLSKFFREYGDNLEAECYLPSAIFYGVNDEKKQIQVYQSTDKWFGLTYQQDTINVELEVTALIKHAPFNRNLES